MKYLAFVVIILGASFYAMLFSKMFDEKASIQETLNDKRQELLWRLNGPIPQDDPRLLALVREKFLVPPPKTRSPKHQEDIFNENESRSYVSWLFIKSVLEDLFTDEAPGFFVEAGALDGSLLSNTLFLEDSYKWTGLLIEPDPRNFFHLKNKHRNAWTAPVCLSHNSYAEKVYLKMNHVAIRHPSQKILGNSHIQAIPGTEEGVYSTFEEIQCFAIESLLLALNISHVHFFSLDIEGGELEILKKFPFDEILVDVWAIENVSPRWKTLKNVTARTLYTSPAQIRKNMSIPDKFVSDIDAILECIEDKRLIDFMLSRGYYYFDAFCYFIPDLVFVRINSTLFSKLHVPKNYWTRRSVCENKPTITHEFNSSRVSPRVLRDPHHHPGVKYRNPISR